MTRLNPQSSNRTLLVVGTVIAVVLIALVVFAARPGGSASGKSFNLAGQPFLGQENAKVSVVVFEDFKCPNCKNFEAGTMPTIQSKYVDTGKAKVYRINFPFIGPDSTTAAEAAECAYQQKGNDGYNQFATLLFRAQGDEKTTWATASKMEELAGYVDGVDAAKFKTCLESEATKGQVDADNAQATKAGINSTPNIFVNGASVPYTGPEGTTPVLSAAIDKALH
ncbi:DsbA family protein [Deinococcus sp.]|uniref:DsbA family protein n=1 Tax=Deinococcus sp. TaxID=47478 RepID=UPI003C7E9FB2